MLKSKYISSHFLKQITKVNLVFIANFLIINYFILIKCDYCPDNIIILNHTKFNTGSINQNGDLIIKYDSQEDNNNIPSSSIFYVLSKNGSYYFLEQYPNTQIKSLETDETEDLIGYNYNNNIYVSKSLFVSLKNDSNLENQNLFIINTYNSTIELHDFNNNTNIKHQYFDFYNFFNLNKDNYLFPFEIALYELKNESIYILAFIPKSLVNENFNEINFIIQFSFKAFEEDIYEELNSVKFNNYSNRIIIDAFFWMIQEFLLLLVLLKQVQIGVNNARLMNMII